MSSPPAPHPRVKDDKKGDRSLCYSTPPLRHPGSPRTAMYTDSWPLPAHTRAPLTRHRRTHRAPQGAIEWVPACPPLRRPQPRWVSIRLTPQAAASAWHRSSAPTGRSLRRAPLPGGRHLRQPWRQAPLAVAPQAGAPLAGGRHLRQPWRQAPLAVAPQAGAPLASSRVGGGSRVDIPVGAGRRARCAGCCRPIALAAVPRGHPV